jgi:uncharacterized protein YdhG (YjbR/CyaY superfamily)
MISHAASVTEFLATLPANERKVFTKIRALFKKTHPKVTESMKYRMPTYMVGEVMVGAFNKQKNYLALYLGKAALDPYRKELKALGMDCGGGCLRFRKPDQLPLALAAKMVKATKARAKG